MRKLRRRVLSLEGQHPLSQNETSRPRCRRNTSQNENFKPPWLADALSIDGRGPFIRCLPSREQCPYTYCREGFLIVHEAITMQ